MESGDSCLINSDYLLYFIGDELVIKLQPDIPGLKYAKRVKNSVYVYWNSSTPNMNNKLCGSVKMSVNWKRLQKL